MTDSHNHPLNILFLTDNFPPEVNAPASRTFEHAREWVKEGHKVTVVTCAPNFPDGVVFPGYSNKILQRQVIDGINIVRVWTYITANEGFAKRTLDYISFMISAVIFCPFLFFRSRPDVVVATSPQFFCAIAGYVVSTILRRPFVFELRDIWPESIKAVGGMKSGWLLGFLERIELFLYKKAAAVVSVTNSFKSNLVERGIDDQKIHVVTNGVDLSRYRKMAKDNELTNQLGLQGKFVIGYIGTHGLAHALDTVLECAAKFQEQGKTMFAFVFLGSGAAKASLIDRAETLNLKNVWFLDTVPKDEVTRYWSLLDTALIHLKRTPLFTTVIPSKMFECMAMGLPILHGVKGESAEIVKRHNVGLTFEPEDASDLQEKIESLSANSNLINELSDNGIAASCEYDRSHLAMSMLDILVETSRPAKG